MQDDKKAQVGTKIKTKIFVNLIMAKIMVSQGSREGKIVRVLSRRKNVDRRQKFRNSGIKMQV